jgi:hypothetical protein
MEPLLIMIPGLIGGLILAFLVLRRRKPESTPDPFGGERLSTDVINMAHVRVAGVGGLGLVAMATLVALYVPAIRVASLLGLALGAVFAIALIAWRRGGPMPSSAAGPARTPHWRLTSASCRRCRIARHRRTATSSPYRYGCEPELPRIFQQIDRDSIHRRAASGHRSAGSAKATIWLPDGAPFLPPPQTMTTYSFPPSL